MPHLPLEQRLQKFDKSRGNMHYLFVPKEIAEQFEGDRPRLLCTIEQKIELACGLNPYGDGNFYIIVATRYLKQMGKKVGDLVNFELTEDPNPLGVEIPEVLTALLEQDSDAKALFDQLTDGKKRSLIHTINRIKDIDKQVETALKFLNQGGLPRRSPR